MQFIRVVQLLVHQDHEDQEKEHVGQIDVGHFGFTLRAIIWSWGIIVLAGFFSLETYFMLHVFITA